MVVYKPQGLSRTLTFTLPQGQSRALILGTLLKHCQADSYPCSSFCCFYLHWAFLPLTQACLRISTFTIRKSFMQGVSFPSLHNSQVTHFWSKTFSPVKNNFSFLWSLPLAHYRSIACVTYYLIVICIVIWIACPPSPHTCQETWVHHPLYAPECTCTQALLRTVRPWKLLVCFPQDHVSLKIGFIRILLPMNKSYEMLIK